LKILSGETIPEPPQTEVACSYCGTVYLFEVGDKFLLSSRPEFTQKESQVETSFFGLIRKEKDSILAKRRMCYEYFCNCPVCGTSSKFFTCLGNSEIDVEIAIAGHGYLGLE